MNGFFDEPASPTASERAADESSFFSNPTSPVAHRRQQPPQQQRQASTSSIAYAFDTSSSLRDRQSSIFDNSNGGDDSRRRRSARGNTTDPTLEEILNPGGLDKGKRVGETDTQAVMRHWRSERAAPEVLIWPEELMERFQRNLLAKKAAVARTFKSLDKDAPPPLRPSALSHSEIHERTTITATENMRADFTLKSYLRARLFKIQKYVQHILSDLRDARERLSRLEFRFAQGYLKAWTTYMEDSFLLALPHNVQRLDEEIMVLQPDFSQAVIIRVRSDCGPVTLPDGVKMALLTGSQHMVRYNTVRELIRLEKVDLL